MGHLRRVDVTASMSARLPKAAVLLRCRALVLRATSGLMHRSKLPLIRFGAFEYLVVPT